MDLDIANMKMKFCLAFFLTLLVVHKAKCGAIKAPLDIIRLEDITKEERHELEAIGEQYERTKRSGSGSPDLLSSLKYILASGAKAKLRLLGRASAAASSSIASASSSSKSYANHGYTYHHPPEEETDSNEAYKNETLTHTEIERIGRSSKPPKSDPWSMKKSVLNTLLQAVKAIKGGVLALKGQLIKGGGYLLVGGGNLVKAKGEVISNLGSKIARSAFRNMHPDHSSEVHEDVSYGHYHPIGLEYGSPSGPGHVEHDHFHHDYRESYPDKTSGVQSGILILKKVPSGNKQHSLHGSETKIAPLATVKPDPNFGNIVGKLLSAASSLNPDSPAPFTDYKHPHPQPVEYTVNEDEHSNDDDQHDQGNFDSDFELEPAFDSPEANKIVEPQKIGEINLGPDSFTNENFAENHGPPVKSPSGDQELPYTSSNDFHIEPQNSPDHPKFSSMIHVNDDFIQQPQIYNPPLDFTNVNKPNEFKFDTTLDSGNFAEPPSNTQNFLHLNAHSSKDNIKHNTQSSNNINGPNIFGHNFAVPPRDESTLFHQNIFPSIDHFNHISPLNDKPSSQNIFDHNLAEPSKSLLHFDNAQDLQIPFKFGFEQPPYYLDQSSLKAGVKIDQDSVELRDKKSSPLNGRQNYKPQPPQSLRKPSKSYNKYRGVVRATPIVNSHIVNPSSNLDLPHFSSNFLKFNQKGNSLFKYPPFIERPSSPPIKPPFSFSPPSSNKNHPFSSSKSATVTGQLYKQQRLPTRSRTHSLPNFDIVQSVTYQLGPNGPKMI